MTLSSFFLLPFFHQKSCKARKQTNGLHYLIDLNRVFRRAAAQSNAQLDPIFDYFQARLSPPQFPGQDDVQFLGSLVDIEYRIEWPFDAFFDAPALDKYRRLFRCLISVKKVQSALQASWMAQSNSWKAQQHPRNRAAPSKDGSLALIWSRRSLMAFFVDNLQFYLQADVIDTQYAAFKTKVQDTQDFDTIKALHEEFLATTSSQCFLTVRSISSALAEALEYCYKFTVQLNQTMLSGGTASLKAAHDSFEVVFFSSLFVGFFGPSLFCFVLFFSKSPHLIYSTLRSGCRSSSRRCQWCRGA